MIYFDFERESVQAFNFKFIIYLFIFCRLISLFEVAV